ncbi:MAG: outer membrane protein OmpK, partial [Cetobacterium sp.]|uniref:outer membrane protein OmpK n=1 Tax=Cetobacterium sp. TaxID=2071632 RepID=UPI003EE4905B
NFVEVEKGGTYDWGSFYGFLDVEQVDHINSKDDIKLSGKAVFTITNEYNINDYIQAFAYAEDKFQVADLVYGKQVGINGRNWYLNPFAGLQYSVINNNFNNTSFEGINGIMVGWSAGYNISEKVSISNWHEFTMFRDNTYLAVSGEKHDIGINGALAAWYHITPNLTTGLQYRYASNKLGSEHGSNGIIYTVKLNF